MIDEIMSRMSLEDKVGQLLMVWLDHKTLDETVKKYRCGSLLIWGQPDRVDWPRDVPDLVALANRAQEPALETRGFPLWLHGFMSGLGWRPGWMADACNRGVGTAEVERAGAILGKRWRAVGIHNHPEPCLNVPLFDSCILRSWAISTDPEIVDQHGVALVRGVTSVRCGTMPQHFPAHGAARLDSHTAFPVIELSTEVLKRVHLRQYRDCFQAGARTICTAHVAVPALDPEPNHVATTSRPILTDLWRGELMTARPPKARTA